eukprot:1158317-Pelagomonas_calceolata.AAC.10
MPLPCRSVCEACGLLQRQRLSAWAATVPFAVSSMGGSYAIAWAAIVQSCGWQSCHRVRDSCTIV